MDRSDGNNNTTTSNGGGSNTNHPTNAPQQQQQQQQRVPHPGDSSRAVRAELEAKRRATVEKQRRYAPLVREQMPRVMGDTAPAWYARLRLLTPPMYARIAEVGVLGLCVAHDRPLSDAEARAVTEHVARGADRMAVISWALSGAALALTWRGRRTLRFPMWTPQVTPPPPGAYLRLAMWHGARYVAYSAALSFTLRAPLMAYSAVHEQQKMKEDPRLRGLRDDEHAAAGDASQGDETWSGDGAAAYTASLGTEDAQQQQQQQPSIQDAAQSGWDTYKQAEQKQTQQQYGQSTQSQSSAGWGSSSSSSYSQSPSTTQQANAGWGSPDLDDGSPVASSAQNGSAWDRLRQHSHRAPQQQQQQQQPPAQSTGGSWGDSGDGADRAAQEKAQRDFDELLERDRQGGQARSGWSGR
ncbi:hypothetical protein A9K55_000764 [Cordyceps militaris]|uniref:Uncharacterized protein n=1 Tax=Cordyceps militaris TaxID=73501 RepID=A0A2H4SUT2_CORMI|nr:hypothetical protein A9K55_000764 [Cordyceps militaris]